MLNPLFLQIESEKVIHEQAGVFSLLSNADPLVKFTLLVLIVFSVVSWAIIFYKWNQLRAAQRNSQSFWNAFVSTKRTSDLLERRQVCKGPLYEIFSTSMDLVNRIKKSPVRSPREYLIKKLNQTREEEMFKLEQYTPFLATTASTAPFIGLFGTVWGILTAFWAIGKAGSTSLATVGPYISEALVATAVGLAAAIPAVIFYNFFVNRIRTVSKMSELFIDDLVFRIEEDANS